MVTYFYRTENLIYALGGYNGRTRMASVERYYPDKNQWEMTTPMNKQRSDASAASLQGKVLTRHRPCAIAAVERYYPDK